MTRGEFMRRTGLNDYDLNKLLHDGTLRASRHTYRKWALYSEEDAVRIHRLVTARHRRTDLDAVTYSAAEAASVIALIEENRTFGSIIVELKLHPFTVQAIMREYARGSGAMILSKAHIDTINRLPLVGVTLPIVNIDDVVTALEAACAEKTCSGCRTRAPSTKCVTCIRQGVEQLIAAKAAAAEVATSSADSDPASSAAE